MIRRTWLYYEKSEIQILFVIQEKIVVTSLFFYLLAAITEIAGCFAFWHWYRNHGSVWILIPGILSLIAFAFFLTRIESNYAGRAYAAYGGVYITASIGWLWLVEKKVPDLWDIVGMTICLLGSAVILFSPRSGV